MDARTDVLPEIKRIDDDLYSLTEYVEEEGDDPRLAALLNAAMVAVGAVVEYFQEASR